MAFSEEMLGLRKALKIIHGIRARAEVGMISGGYARALEFVRRAIEDELEHNEGPKPF